tara:strand:- start:156 stop:302 length:147 start_codon:yes stop_codon:yes gene_type:complete
MSKYTLAETISKNWTLLKTRDELQKELMQLLILLPVEELKEINNKKNN